MSKQSKAWPSSPVITGIRLAFLISDSTRPVKIGHSVNSPFPPQDTLYYFLSDITPTMATLTQDQIKVLEQTRQRLVQLTHSLGSLAASLQQSDPLPSWYATFIVHFQLATPRKRFTHAVFYPYRSSLQSQASIISNNLLSVSEQLSEHRELLFSLVAYPGPDYPGKTQANVLEQLLRTKLDPRVEDWVARGRTAGASALENKEGQLSEHELAELWEWAPIEANMEARRRNWGGNFTLEEKEMGIQNVVTGLRRRLDLEEEEEAEEDEEEEEGEKGGLDTDKMEVVASEGNRVPPKPVSPALPLDEVLRYMMTGAPPKSR